VNEAGLLQLDGALDFRFEAKDGPAGADVAWDDIQKWQLPIEGSFTSGKTRVYHVGQIRPGRFVTLFITAKAIDSEGDERPTFARYDERSL
jgi:hypothetical protein